MARKARWEEHVRLRHPEVASHFAAVRLTLEAPDVIVSDFDNPHGLNYYRFGALSAPYHRLFLKVVVTFQQIDNAIVGAVITTSPTGRIAHAEVQQWP
ncbi:MAG: hypothetical protein U0031_18740 [Thermomicrobiales bacterium]